MKSTRGNKTTASRQQRHPHFRQEKNALFMQYCAFSESRNEILKNPVTLIQILARKPIIKIDNIALTHSKLWVQEMINLEHLHRTKMF